MDSIELDKFRHWRGLLSSKFSLLSGSIGRETKEVVLSDKDLVLTRRVFYERDEDREFSVCVEEESDNEIYAFVKNVGDGDDVKLLYIITNNLDVSLPKIAELYKDWLIRRAPRDVVDFHIRAL